MITQRMESNIETLAKDAARHPEKVGPYCQFLVTANEAARLASPEQRSNLRAFVASHPGGFTPEEATTAIEKIMGWETGCPRWSND